MSFKSEKRGNETSVLTVDVGAVPGSHDLSAVKHDDDALLAQLGYKSEFKREFSVWKAMLLQFYFVLTSLRRYLN